MKTLYRLGERYTYYDKNLCYDNSLKAINLGYQVRYGISSTGMYYYEIIDPFKKEQQQ